MQPMWWIAAILLSVFGWLCLGWFTIFQWQVLGYSPIDGSRQQFLSRCRPGAGSC